MKKTTKKLVSLMMATAMAASLTACGGSEKPAETTAAPAAAATEAAAAETEAAAPSGASVSQDMDIVAACAVDFTTMDPLDTSDTLSGGVQRMIMDGLFGFDDDMGIIPMLATEYEANDDATEFIIKLRQGISFSDGTPWNAEAAKANLDRWNDDTLGLKRTSLLCNILDTIEVVDEYTVKVTLTDSFGAFIPTLAHPACVCVSPKTIAAGEEECAANPVGTGQYTFVEWVAGEKTTVALNKDWWGYDAEICGGTPLVDADAGFKTVTFKPTPEAATQVAMVQAGDAQVIWPVPTESMELLKGDSNVAVGQATGIVVRYLTMNTQKAPFDNKLVRQAVNYAINKEAYCAVVKNGIAVPGTSIIGPSVQYYKENAPYEYNPEKAKELLAEAGYPDGFKTTIMCNTTSSNMKQAEFYQQQLALAGIDVEIVALENAVLNQRIQDVDVPGSEAEVNLYITGWSPSTGDADWGIRPLLASESVPPHSYNMCYWQDEHFDSLVQAALNTADDAKRAEAYAEIQDIIWDECPLVATCTDDNTWATSAKVADVKIYPDGALNIRNGKMYE